jgi:Protein of unknown function (DUF3102)
LETQEKKTIEELHALAGRILWYEEEVRKTVGLALQYKLEIGRSLARAKQLLPHGKFLAWAQHEFGWTPRHVQNHLALAANAKHVSHLGPGASLRMALAAIKESRADASKAVDSPTSIGPRPAIESVQRIQLIGEFEEGEVDCRQLVLEVERISAALGAPNARWKARWCVCRPNSLEIEAKDSARLAAAI